MMPLALCAPDKFAGTATALQIASAMAKGARRAGWRAVMLPLSDGGEGFVQCFAGELHHHTVSGPLGAPVEARWRMFDDHAVPTAVIEMASCSGLGLVGGRQHNDPLAATTYGTGELIVTAAAQGAKRILLGCGGSATTDGGRGAISAIEHRQGVMQEVEIVAAYDVTTGFLDAASVFGPQKGANKEQVEILRRRLSDLAEHYRANYGIDVTTLQGAGAAGGLAGGLAAIGARLCSGFELVAQHHDLTRALADADVVITGEGSFDATSLSGKVVGELINMTGDQPVIVIAGVVDAPTTLPEPVTLASLSARYGLSRSLRQPAQLVETVTSELLDGIDLSR